MSEFRNTEHELYHFQVRVSIAGAVVMGAFFLLFLRFAYLQVVRYDYYRTKAEDNRISVVPITPNRGNIVDRNGVVLARNYSAYTLEIAPGKVGDMERTISELGGVIDIRPSDRSRFRRLMIEAKGAETLPIRTRLTDDEVAKFAAQRYRFPGVDIRARLFRQYPYGEEASHALGYIGRINDKDLEWIEDQSLTSNYKGTDHVGKTGIEQNYELELHGTTGYEQVEVDAAGRGVRTISKTAPISGNNLILTLDMGLQQVVETAFGDRRGALIAIEPGTGGILAFVSKPGFDPNLFVDGIDPVNWKELNESLDRPLNNRALSGVYPPGSTFKPYMALAALESGKRTPTQTIFDPGYFDFGGRRFRDDKVGGHGTVDMYKSLVVSCDTYYYQLGNDLGIDIMSRFIGQFGFGSKTGIDIQGESVGILPSQEWKQKRFRRPEQQKWYAGETISVAIGQGYNAYTPLQLAQAMATLANNGVMYKPHLVKYVENVNTGERRVVEPQPLKTIPLKQENVDFIKKAMAGVNTEGTGARAFAKAEYTSAGKTGTAQVIAIKAGEKYVESRVAERHRDHALFIAFAPVESPKIALAVLVENAGFGAAAAAPIARLVLDYYLLGKKPASPPKKMRELPTVIDRLLRRIMEPLDGTLLGIVMGLVALGFLTLYSASYEIPGRVAAQGGNLLFALVIMWVAAQLSPQLLMRLAPPVYAVGLALLVAVALGGDIRNGARRWLNLGVTSVQPSELMKIAMPLMLAWYFQKRETVLRWYDYGVAAVILMVPVGLIAKQPDLGTALLVAAAGFYVIFLAGLSWKVIIGVVVACLASTPLLWGVMHDYQRKRILTLIDPSEDPLGAGYHIIQSTIAIGSGGFFGKGWLNGTQTHLEFIPERHTDFIFAVFSEEFGLIGNTLLIVLYLALIARGLMMAANAPTFFARLLSGSIILIFFTYAFVNMGMVSGLLPVVGVPLPLVSYGGTAMVTLFCGLGILMSMHRHRKLVQT